ncbi:hypothetical protein GQ457_18G018100 [Hibiscus cannabinus]
MNVRVVKIKVLGDGCFGVVHLVKTIAPVYNKVYAMKSADEDHSSSLRKKKSFNTKQVGVSKVKYGFQGSVPYMSPESILGDVTGALDVWSLGCVVVEMITGRLPWDTCDANDLMLKLFSGESPNIPEDMSILGKDFLQKCFVSDPNQRWSASMLLRHPYLLPDPVSLPRGFQQSYKEMLRGITVEKEDRNSLSQKRKEKERRTCAYAAKNFRALTTDVG